MLNFYLKICPHNHLIWRSWDYSRWVRPQISTCY